MEERIVVKGQNRTSSVTETQDEDWLAPVKGRKRKAQLDMKEAQNAKEDVEKDTVTKVSKSIQTKRGQTR